MNQRTTFSWSFVCFDYIIIIVKKTIGSYIEWQQKRAKTKYIHVQDPHIAIFRRCSAERNTYLRHLSGVFVSDGYCFLLYGLVKKETTDVQLTWVLQVHHYNHSTTFAVASIPLDSFRTDLYVDRFGLTSQCCCDAK